MVRTLLCALGTISLLLAAAATGGAWYFSSQLLYPETEPCKKKHFVYCGSPAETGVGFEDISFNSPDGVPLKGWYFGVKGSGKAVVMVHGITADRHEGLRWVKALHGAGYNLIMFDLRNHGKSGKAVSGMGFMEKHDIRGAVDFLYQRGIKKVGLFAVSMGAASGIPAMALDRRIIAGIFEAPFASLEEQLADVGTRDYGLPKFPLLTVTLAFFEMRGGYKMKDMNPESYIGLISPRPVFIIHCKKDNLIDYKHGLRVFEAAGKPKQMWTAPCNEHAEAWNSSPEEAERRVLDFFGKNL